MINLPLPFEPLKTLNLIKFIQLNKVLVWLIYGCKGGIKAAWLLNTFLIIAFKNKNIINGQTEKTIVSRILNELGIKEISTNFLAYRNQWQFWDIKQTIFNRSS